MAAPATKLAVVKEAIASGSNQSGIALFMCGVVLGAIQQQYHQGFWFPFGWVFQ